MTRRRDCVTIAGSRVRALRHARGWSQLELSCRTGMSQYGISRLETGLARRVQFRTLHKLARVLGVEPEVLARNHPGPSSI